MCLTLKPVKRCKYSLKLFTLGCLFSLLDFIHTSSFCSLQLDVLWILSVPLFRRKPVFLQCFKGEKLSLFEICVIDLVTSKLGHERFHQMFGVCVLLQINFGIPWHYFAIFQFVCHCKPVAVDFLSALDEFQSTAGVLCAQDASWDDTSIIENTWHSELVRTGTNSFAFKLWIEWPKLWKKENDGNISFLNMDRPILNSQ
jgi:hypothetical protein